jgi:hypothetical protein
VEREGREEVRRGAKSGEHYFGVQSKSVVYNY